MTEANVQLDRGSLDKQDRRITLDGASHHLAQAIQSGMFTVFSRHAHDGDQSRLAAAVCAQTLFDLITPDSHATTGNRADAALFVLSGRMTRMADRVGLDADTFNHFVTRVDGWSVARQTCQHLLDTIDEHVMNRLTKRPRVAQARRRAADALRAVRHDLQDDEQLVAVTECALGLYDAIHLHPANTDWWPSRADASDRQWLAELARVRHDVLTPEPEPGYNEQ